ncbi:MAG: CPBP family intramembrane metalloprotease [Gemmatimonadota bacterium]|jgi:membrane protease YdiL (CAAX protease family)
MSSPFPHPAAPGPMFPTEGALVGVGAMPDPGHWGLNLGLAALCAFLVRSAWKDLRRPERVPEDAGPDPRARLFRDTIVSLWAAALLTVFGWLQAGGDLRSLGFVLLPGWGSWAAWAVAVLGSAFLVQQWRMVGRSESARDRYAIQVDQATGFDWVRPTTAREYRLFKAMALTAGITEEVVFRGFLIGALSLWIHPWLAAGLALVIFVGAHVYQGITGMVRILPVSVVLTVLFMVSGSVLPGILLHATVDLAAGAIMWALRDRRGLSPGAGVSADGLAILVQAQVRL